MDKFYGNTLPNAGEVKQIVIPVAPNMPCYLYRPKQEKSRSQVIVAIHGISRNHRQQVQGYQKLADQLGVWLIAPLFKKNIFGQYQQIVNQQISARADLSLNSFLIAWRLCRQLPSLGVHMTGYSGGAQFAHRYSLAYPQLLKSLVLCSPGWYTYLDKQVAYPRGLSRWPTQLPNPELSKFLSIPLLLVIGAEDIEVNASLRSTDKLNKQQGDNRFERACRWFAHLKKALPKQTSTAAKLLILESEGHDFASNAANSSLQSNLKLFWQQSMELPS